MLSSYLVITMIEKIDKDIIANGEEICDYLKIEYDKKMKCWVKVIDGVDLSQHKGFSLLGEFYSLDKKILIKNKQYIVFGFEEKINKYEFRYKYFLIKNEAGELIKIKPDIEQFKDKLGSEIYVKCLNSVLYRIAVFISYN